MTYWRALVMVLVTVAIFSASGAAFGWLIGTSAPEYYRAVLRAEDDPVFSPISAGMALGLMQGAVLGACIGALLVLAVAVYPRLPGQRDERGVRSGWWSLAVVFFFLCMALVLLAGCGAGYFAGGWTQSQTQMDLLEADVGKLVASRSEFNQVSVDRTKGIVQVHGTVSSRDAQTMLDNELDEFLLRRMRRRVRVDVAVLDSSPHDH